MKQYSDDIKNAVDVLRNKGIILYPTDTVWGIGCDATSVEAFRKIFSLKKRNENNSLILLIDSESRLSSYVSDIPEQAWQLIEFSEKPLTIVYEKARNLPAEVISSDGSVAIRITKDEFCRDLISALRKPLISTSANISGMPAPSSFGEITPEITEGVDYVVKWRQEESMTSKPSTIISVCNDGRIKIIRK